MGILKQDHFRYEEDRLIDVVIKAMPFYGMLCIEKDNHYIPKKIFTEEDGYRLSELEEIVMHEGGYEAESIAKNLFLRFGYCRKISLWPS